MPPRKKPRNDPSASLVNTPSIPNTQLGLLTLSSQSAPQNTTKKKKRGSAKAVEPVTEIGKDGTPLPEQGWWSQNGGEWDNDALPGGKTSYRLLIEYLDIPEHMDYWRGQGGGNAKKGAIACRKWLYEHRAPTRRSASAIERKFNLIHGKWKDADEFRNRTGAGRGMTLIREAPEGKVQEVVADVDERARQICPDFEKWTEIFKGRTAGDPAQQAHCDDEYDPSTHLLGRLVGDISPSPAPGLPAASQASPEPSLNLTPPFDTENSFINSPLGAGTQEIDEPFNNGTPFESVNPNDIVSQSLRDRATVEEAENQFRAQEGDFLQQQLKFARTTAQSQQEENELRRRGVDNAQKYQDKKLEIAERELDIQRKRDIMKSATRMMGEGKMEWSQALRDAKEAYDTL